MASTEESIAELLALYRLVHRKEIDAGKQELLEDGTRLSIYEACAEPKSQKQLMAITGLAQPTVSGHVRKLVDAGLLRVDRNNGVNLYWQHL